MKQPHLSSKSLSDQRDQITAELGLFNLSKTPSKSCPVRKDVVSSWQRSALHVDNQISHAPVEDEYSAKHRWAESPLRPAAQKEMDHLIQLSNEGELVAAIADPSGQLLWTFASNHMRGLAESLNFVKGGHWDEHSVGTNAVGLSLELKQAVTVFSSEHYLPFVHDWVCYAAPIIHPQSGQCLGTLDISTTWKRHTPLGQSAVAELARSIAQRLPQTDSRAELELHALGQPYILFQGKIFNPGKRQMEILCLLALNPDGLTLEGLHAALYGDMPISTSTLKAELSHLRSLLDGQIGSRPYRLLSATIWADFIYLWQAIRVQNSSEAFSLFRGSFLPHSESPELSEWRYCIDAAMDSVVKSCNNPDTLINELCNTTAGSRQIRERLLELSSQDMNKFKGTGKR